MAKVDQTQQGRNDGLRYALQILDNNGGDIEALRKEIRQRGITGVGIRATHAELDQACKAIKCQILDCVLVMAMHVLTDEFGFGAKRLDRFKDRYNSKTECMLDGRMTWVDILETLAEEDNQNLKIRYNE